MEILRLAGGPGVGKSTVAWMVRQRLGGDGVRTGYVDIDQLGMCYPAPQDDPDRWAVKERALARIAHVHEAAGVELLVVSGVAETRTPPPAHGHPATSIWLDADERVRRSRLAARGWPEAQVALAADAGTEEARHAHADWIRLATDDLSAVQVADRVRAAVPRREDEDARPVRAAPAPSSARARVLWITGPRLAGVSTIGWRLVSEQWAAGIRTGFADAAQLAFTPEPARAIPAGVAVLHETFAEVGATALVVVAPDGTAPHDVVAAFPEAEVTVLRIAADTASRRARAEERRRGLGPILAGDDLGAATDAEIDALIAASGPVTPAPGVLVVDTSGLDVDAATQAVRAALAAHGRVDRRPARS